MSIASSRNGNMNNAIKHDYSWIENFDPVDVLYDIFKEAGISKNMQQLNAILSKIDLNKIAQSIEGLDDLEEQEEEFEAQMKAAVERLGEMSTSSGESHVSSRPRFLLRFFNGDPGVTTFLLEGNKPFMLSLHEDLQSVGISLEGLEKVLTDKSRCEFMKTDDGEIAFTSVGGNYLIHCQRGFLEHIQTAIEDLEKSSTIRAFFYRIPEIFEYHERQEETRREHRDMRDRDPRNFRDYQGRSPDYCEHDPF